MLQEERGRLVRGGRAAMMLGPPRPSLHVAALLRLLLLVPLLLLLLLLLLLDLLAWGVGTVGGCVDQLFGSSTKGHARHVRTHPGGCGAGGGARP